MNRPSWWKNAAVVTAFAGVLVVAIAGKEQAAARAEDASSIAAVDRLFAQWNRPDSPGCGVGISRNGTLAYERGYGMANLELGVPITPATVFAAGSYNSSK